MVSTGLEVLLSERLGMLESRRVGVVTNHSAVTSGFTHVVDALLSKGVKVSALFGPEHGVRGEVADGEEITSDTDSRTGLPAFSLYGAVKKPTPEMMDKVDTLVFDIQDVGSRFYTYLYTMAYCLQACAEHGKPFIVLDRPNPITGARVEGPILKEGFSSFIGMYAIPTRPGMTVGELARYFNSEVGINAELEVIPCKGWKRGMWFDQTGLPWILPSPGMPTLDTATVYPGFCNFEGTNMSEGRGTTKPFETFGAPFIDAYALADELNREGLEGITFRPTYFIPTSSKHSGKSCGGVQGHVTDRKAFQPVFAGLKAIEVIHRMYPNDFALREPGPSGHTHFDLLVGSDEIRLAISAGKTTEEIAAGWTAGLEDFLRRRQGYLLYE